MTYALIVRGEAEADLLQAARWYEDRREGLGAAFLNEVNRLLQSIRRNPRQFKVRYKKHKLRWALLNRFPYKIVYLLQKETIYVIAVTHAARHHSAWKRRIG
jgi:plasmid stabilization system protein ParE